MTYNLGWEMTKCTDLVTKTMYLNYRKNMDPMELYIFYNYNYICYLNR